MNALAQHTQTDQAFSPGHVCYDSLLPEAEMHIISEIADLYVGTPSYRREGRTPFVKTQFIDAAQADTPLSHAIELFMNSKRGEHLAKSTLYKHTLTLNRLKRFCDVERVILLKDITLTHLTTWRAKWGYESPLAKRNNQDRVKSFFKFCSDAGIIRINPALQLSKIQVKSHEPDNAGPFEPQQHNRILMAISKTKLEPRSQSRVKACMQLQRWAGLSLVDAVCLSNNELRQSGKLFRIQTRRRKTGVHINNVIPFWLGKELLQLKRRCPEYFFISGNATQKGAVSIMDKMYRRVFKVARIEGTSQMFRHTFSVELLKAGVDIRKVSKALGHSSVTITERYYAKWNKAQQQILDRHLARAWA
jgi:integrase/recombinase XerD